MHSGLEKKDSDFLLLSMLCVNNIAAEFSSSGACTFWFKNCGDLWDCDMNRIPSLTLYPRKVQEKS